METGQSAIGLRPGPSRNAAGSRTAAALAKSVARVPEAIDGPAIKAASPIGAALDLIAQYETPTGTGS